MKLFEDLERCKEYKKEYKLIPSLRFHRDTDSYYFSFIPTVLWMPWIYRYPNLDGVIDIWWLHFHILIGKWEQIGDDN